jgi:hypothetical protein
MYIVDSPGGKRRSLENAKTAQMKVEKWDWSVGEVHRSGLIMSHIEIEDLVNDAIKYHWVIWPGRQQFEELTLGG